MQTQNVLVFIDLATEKNPYTCIKRRPSSLVARLFFSASLLFAVPFYQQQQNSHLIFAFFWRSRIHFTYALPSLVRMLLKFHKITFMQGNRCTDSELLTKRLNQFIQINALWNTRSYPFQGIHIFMLPHIVYWSVKWINGKLTSSTNNHNTHSMPIKCMKNPKIYYLEILQYDVYCVRILAIVKSQFKLWFVLDKSSPFPSILFGTTSK